MIPQGIKATAGHEKKKERDNLRVNFVDAIKIIG